MDDDKKSLFFFGKDLRKDPCIKNTGLNGIYCGFGFGCAYFLYSGNVLKATNRGVHAFFIAAIASELYCRYQWHQKNKLREQYRKALRGEAIFDDKAEVESESTD